MNLDDPLRNPPAQYSIYYMNHGKEVYIANHTTLDLGLGYSIFAIYTSLPWFIYNIWRTTVHHDNAVGGILYSVFSYS